ncbi:MAG TPA: thioredoxin domain-containing protein [Polyangiaceae bacterium]|nr:thioredoxin domain-containing protein [Polyangiaceae bacterium]
MRSSSLPFRSLALLLGLFSLGASCNHGQESAKRASEQAASSKEAPLKAAKVERLERIDTSGLTDPERRSFIDLANEVLSPCGEPVSVAQCVAETRSCGACVPGARYLVRLISEGYERSEILELFALRFDPKRKVSIDTAQAPVRGAPMAKVSIVEFSDFECPHCGAAHPILARVLEEYAGKVNLVFKQFPLDSHKNAATAAKAAVAAQAQHKFWELADQLFEHQRELSPDTIHGLAKSVGLDLNKFDADLGSTWAEERVDADKKEGTALGIQGTPSLFINGRAYKEGMQSLSKYLKEELEL